MSLPATGRRGRVPFGVSWRWLVAAALWLPVPDCSRAQGPAPPVDEAVARLARNVAAYTATLPDLFCEERFTSRRFADGHQTDSRTTVSTLRIQHGSGARAPGNLVETRTVHEVDGSPAHGSRIRGPYTLDGGFDRALAIFLGATPSCLQFKAAPTDASSELRLTFAALTTLPPACPANLLGRTGEVTLDRTNLEPLQIRQTLPHPAGSGNQWSRLVWTVTFAPVSLGDRIFYAPSSVRSELFRQGSPEYLQSIAEYSGYHKLEVSSHIVPGTPQAGP